MLPDRTPFYPSARSMVWLVGHQWRPLDMHIACTHTLRMRTIQIRNVPDQLHRRIKVRAALEGQSLSEYALRELRRSMERPTRREWWTAEGVCADQPPMVAKRGASLDRHL